MPKYLLKASYTTAGVKGLLKDGGSGRQAAVEQMTQGLGGKLEAFYFAHGETDVYVIADLPDAETATAMSLAVTASGTTEVQTVPLLTPAQVDAAVAKSVDYRPPGG